MPQARPLTNCDAQWSSRRQVQRGRGEQAGGRGSVGVAMKISGGGNGGGGNENRQRHGNDQQVVRFLVC